MRIHDVFHVSSLKLYRAGGPSVTVPPPAFLPTGSVEDEIDSIVNHILKDGNAEFLVTWKDGSQPLWMANEFLTNARNLVSDYCARNSVAVPELNAAQMKAARLQKNKDPKKKELRQARAGIRRSSRLAAQNCMDYEYY